MRDVFLPFSRPDLDGSEMDLVRKVLESGWLTTGVMTHELERDFAARVGAKHAIAVNSCTAALHLALEAVGVRPDDEVITSPYTFASSAEVIRYFGARPQFVDIEPDTFNIDPSLLEEALTSHTRAVIPVHFGGHPADMAVIDELASAHGFALVEDAAHALPSSYAGNIIGSRRPSLGDAPQLTCFSFYATKTMTTGEGGMITTDDPKLAERCRLMSLHGISNDAWNRYTESGSWYYEIIAPGYKYNLTDVAAAMGIAQLARLDIMRDRRAMIAERFSAAFREMPSLVVPTSRPGVGHSWHIYALRLDLDRLSVTRDRFIDELRKRGIGVSVHFIPLHIHPYYREMYDLKPEDFPVAYREFMREISLPIYSAMTDSDIDRVISAVLDVAHKYKR